MAGLGRLPAPCLRDIRAEFRIELGHVVGKRVASCVARDNGGISETGIGKVGVDEASAFPQARTVPSLHIRGQNTDGLAFLSKSL